MEQYRRPEIQWDAVVIQNLLLGGIKMSCWNMKAQSVVEVFWDRAENWDTQISSLGSLELLCLSASLSSSLSWTHNSRKSLQRVAGGLQPWIFLNCLPWSWLDPNFGFPAVSQGCCSFQDAWDWCACFLGRGKWKNWSFSHMPKLLSLLACPWIFLPA